MSEDAADTGAQRSGSEPDERPDADADQSSTTDQSATADQHAAGQSEPTAAEPVAEDAAAEQSVVDEPAAEESVVDEPDGEEPVAEEPAPGETTADESTTDKPVTEEPVVEEPDEQNEPEPVDQAEPARNAPPQSARPSSALADRVSGSSLKLAAVAAGVAVLLLVALLVAITVFALGKLWPGDDQAAPETMNAKRTASQIRGKNVNVPPGFTFESGTFYPVQFGGAPSFQAAYLTDDDLQTAITRVESVNPTFPELIQQSCEVDAQRALLLSLALPCPSDEVVYAATRADPGTSPARAVRPGWDSQTLILIRRDGRVELRISSDGH